MTIFNDSLLIAAAPPEILVGVGVFFCISSLILFVLSVEAGNYPELSGWIRSIAAIKPRSGMRSGEPSVPLVYRPVV